MNRWWLSVVSRLSLVEENADWWPLVSPALRQRPQGGQRLIYLKKSERERSLRINVPVGAQCSHVEEPDLSVPASESSRGWTFLWCHM